MDTIISDQNPRHEPAAFIVMRPDLSIADPGTLRLGDAVISATIPPLCRPDNIIADSGTVRLGDAEVSAQLPRF
jgi:hypothetical protein